MIVGGRKSSLEGSLSPKTYETIEKLLLSQEENKKQNLVGSVGSYLKRNPAAIAAITAAAIGFGALIILYCVGINANENLRHGFNFPYPP